MTIATLQIDGSAETRPRARFLLAVLFVGTLVAACTWFSIGLTRFEGGVAALWVANGLLTGVLLVSPRATWRWWFAAAAIGQLAGRLVHESSWWLALLIVALNLLESGIVASWVRRQSASLGEGSSIGRMSLDAVLSTMVACAVSATLAAPLLSNYAATPLLDSWLIWFTAHVTGMVVVATFTVCALQPKVGLLGRAGKRLDYVLCLSMLLVVGCVVFWQDRYPMLFVTYLPLMFLVWRHGLSGMIVGMVLLAGVSGVAATQAAGPFALIRDATPLAQILFWQVYVAAGCLLAYSTAVSMARRRKLERDLLRSEASYRKLAADAERLARFDSLTGLPNRRHFDEALAAAVVRATRNGTALMLLSLDLDHFKDINDSLGHAGGDAVLTEFGRRLRNSVFDVDLVARLGGDEFVVLVEYTPTEDAGRLIAQRVLESMRAPFRIEGANLVVGTSIGIGVAPVPTAAKLMQLADEALYEAKARGRNTVALRAG